MKPNPYLKADESWISLSGEVTSVLPDSFLLDYGDGVVTVEMDDWDSDADGYKVVEDDKVTVYGRIDDDLWETTLIEASSVYVEGLNTHFYASAADEEDSIIAWTAPVVISSTLARGKVTDVNALTKEITLNTGDRRITVDTSAMTYDPLDDSGFQQIDVGDRVSVSGTMTKDFFNDRELLAEYIVTLSSREQDS